ncbi:gamma-tubulin complex component 6-like [Mercenaria mercenaria]|uniref:gamma-tubulin complex component 6-like n=1 Tax=Mercenaria mercenaria TaxID=6596 RepID=UPI00234F1280|nr:gamma-tubulin complex component 6-like [Mercenaria mercenaria]
MASTESITEAFGYLCNYFTPEKKRATLGRQPQSRKQIRSNLKKRLYRSLFTYLKNTDRHVKHSDGDVIEKVKSEYSWLILSLRKRRRYDDANRLESLLSKLCDSDDRDNVFSVLQVLLKLKDTGSAQKPQAIGHEEVKLPVQPKRGYEPVLPEGPLCYGDTQIIQPDRFHYMHYPRLVFEGQSLEIINPVTNLCEQLPGCGLSGNGFFSVGSCLGDLHEQITTHTLFGGLVQGRVNSLDVKLDIPELPEDLDNNLLETRIPKSVSSYSNDLVDEGFKSQEESLTSSTTGEDMPDEVSFDSVYQSDYDTSIYETCLTEKISQYYTWETVGLGPGPRTKPYLTEAGPEAFDHLNKTILKNLTTAFPSIRVSPRQEISQEELVKEILNMMIAVPSVNFMLDLTDQCFTMRDGLYVSGMSAEAVQNLLDDFLTCGMYFYRLGLFAATPVIDSFYSAGLTFHAFTGAVQSVLHYYSGVILSIGEGKTLLQLRVKCHKLLQEIRYLACLCHCDNPVTEETKTTFPTGIPLLSYLYSETVEASFSDHYPLMLSLLKHTCTPYLLYVQDWVYHGLYRDAYGEFMVQVNDDYLQFKDKHYWTQGYTLGTNRVEESVPLFLKELANDIFLCGKSINLLKACKRDHFLCDVDDSDIAKITLTFSETELRTLTNQCTIYANRMKQIARQLTLSREEMKARADRAKYELMVRARQTQAAELKRLEDKVKERRKAVAAKKRKELTFLKNQMETDLKRRAEQKETALKENKDYMDSVTNRENMMDEEELELERQAREEVIAYYSQLSEEAARREQKALWRVRRARLDIKRTEFLIQEQRQLAAEMEKFKSDPTEIQTNQQLTVRPASPTLPGWARKGLHGPTIEVTGDDEQDGMEEAPKLEGGDKNLPKWALKGLEKYGIKSKSPSPVKSPLRPVTPRSGRSTPARRSLNSSFHVSDETQEAVSKPSIQTFENRHATKESGGEVEPVSKSHVKMVDDHHASKETDADQTNRPHIKTVSDKHITQQSEPEPESRPHIRSYDNMHANKPSDAPEHDNVPKLKLGVMQSSTESKPMEWKIKKQNVFGHVSQISSSYDFNVPKMKKSAVMSSSKESDWSTDFAIKPRIRINRKQTANTQSEEVQTTRQRIKMSDKMCATKESEFIDYEQKRVQMFKERNIYGHATDSSVERLLYDGKFGQKSKDANESISDVRIIPKLDEIEWLTSEVEKYQDNFDILNNPPRVDLLSSVPGIQYGSYGNYDSFYGDIEGYQYLPLKTVIKSSITSVLETQVCLVNESLVRYFLADLQIEDHFMALRRYLCMGDGDFSEILCDLLMEKLGTNPRPQDLVNPMFLNNCLNKAVRLSVNADDKYADNVSFIHKYLPRTLEQTSPDLFDCIQLHYEVKWPLNIVITENSLHKYSQVFSFMLQLKRVVWVLKDVWNRLKRDAIVHKLDRLFEFRELHLFRQEMQLFVKVMQEYISHQIVDVTWQEFQTALTKHVHNVDDLHQQHNKYLDNALFRCLLTKNATSLMKVIQDIFCLILKFHRQLVTGTWHPSQAGHKTHSNHARMKHTYKVFHEHSTFLFKVVSKLADRGYEPHLHDLLLRLNFNHYYDKQS